MREDHIIRADLDHALKIMREFNHVVAHGPFPRRESQLPYGKGRIKNALVYVYAAVHNPAAREVIKRSWPADQAEKLLSIDFEGAITSLIFGLPDFGSDEQAEIIASARKRAARIPDGPPETLHERIAAHSREMGPVTDDDLALMDRCCAIIRRTHDEGDMYLKEASNFDLF